MIFREYFDGMDVKSSDDMILECLKEKSRCCTKVSNGKKMIEKCRTVRQQQIEEIKHKLQVILILTSH